MESSDLLLTGNERIAVWNRYKSRYPDPDIASAEDFRYVTDLLQAQISKVLAAGYLPPGEVEASDFAYRIAKVFNKLRDSHVFFYLQQAYPEVADEWEWSNFQELLNKISSAGMGKNELR